MDPFGAEIRHGFSVGPRALDMKSIGVQQLTALIALHKLGCRATPAISYCFPPPTRRPAVCAASSG